MFFEQTKKKTRRFRIWVLTKHSRITSKATHLNKDHLNKDHHKDTINKGHHKGITNNSSSQCMFNKNLQSWEEDVVLPFVDVAQL